MEEAPRTNLRASARAAWLVVPAVALLAAGAWFLMHRGEGSSGSPAPAAAPAAAAPAPAPAAPAAEDVAPATAADARGLLEGLSAWAPFHRWLASGDVVKRWAALTADVAEGASPRRLLLAFAPKEPFTVERQGDGLVIAPASYARYDAVAAAIGGLDARGAATAYRRLHGVLEAAYRALGYPAGALDKATSRALHRLAGAPAPEAPRVVRGEGGYVFADPALEQRTEVEKQLLRMGPRNARLVQGKARELLEALELPAVASGR